MTAIITDDQDTLDRLVRAFPLTPASLVWIAGAWHGAQVQWFAEFYKCDIWAFEPQPEAFADLKSIDYPGLEIFNFGLGDRYGVFDMCKPGTDACSFIVRDSKNVVPGPYIQARMVDIAYVVGNLRQVNLFLMNMEGYELILLPYLMQTGLITRFDHFMTQFHLGWEGAVAYSSIRRDMEATHEIIWEYRTPAWVTWRRKGLA